MAKIDDLNNAVTALASGFAALDKAVTDQLQKITDAEGDSDAIDQAVANINAITSKMSADAAMLTKMVPAASTLPTPPVQSVETESQPDVTIPEIASPEVTEPAAKPPSDPPQDAFTQ